MIKNLLSLFLIFFVLGMPVFAQTNTTIEKLENSVFGMTYSNQTEKQRVERLEKGIYGAIQTGNLQQRVDKLSKDMSADLIGQEITPSKYTEIEEAEDATVDYPLIDGFEKQVFNKAFKNKKLEQRLSALEKNIFKKTYEHDDLNTRTERLKIAIGEPVSSKIDDSNNLYDYGNFSSNSNFKNYKSQNDRADYQTPQNYDKNIGKALTALEKKIFKKTYQNLNEEERLEQLEEKMFSASFPQDSIESRLERLALAYQATRTSKKYDTNKLSQHMATAMQVGMFVLMILAMVL